MKREEWYAKFEADRKVRIAQGLCGRCGKEPIATGRSEIMGTRCLDRLLMKQRAHVLEKRAEDLRQEIRETPVTQPDKQPHKLIQVNPGTKTLTMGQMSYRLRKELARTKGICIYGNHPIDEKAKAGGFIYCSECRKKNLIRTAIHKRRRRAPMDRPATEKPVVRGTKKATILESSARNNVRRQLDAADGRCIYCRHPRDKDRMHLKSCRKCADRLDRNRLTRLRRASLVKQKGLFSRIKTFLFGE